MIPERLAFDDVAGVSGEFEAGMPCPADGKLLYKKLPGLTKRQLSSDNQTTCAGISQVSLLELFFLSFAGACAR